jgi:hypothetical protein
MVSVRIGSACMIFGAPAYYIQHSGPTSPALRRGNFARVKPYLDRADEIVEMCAASNIELATRTG